jgi:hypothetical protein
VALAWLRLCSFSPWDAFQGLNPGTVGHAAADLNSPVSLGGLHALLGVQLLSATNQSLSAVRRHKQRVCVFTRCAWVLIVCTVLVRHSMLHPGVQALKVQLNTTAQIRVVSGIARHCVLAPVAGE